MSVVIRQTLGASGRWGGRRSPCTGPPLAASVRRTYVRIHGPPIRVGNASPLHRDAAGRGTGPGPGEGHGAGEGVARDGRAVTTPSWWVAEAARRWTRVMPVRTVHLNQMLTTLGS